MKEIVIISGKGGTGKTSITACFALLGGRNVVVADCDVDAADMHLLLQPDYAQSEDFYSGLTAVIDQGKCSSYGKCAEVCRFDAIPVIDSCYRVTPLNCEGCSYCFHVCPEKAIAMNENNIGKWHISTTRIGSTMVHARLGIGAENSGKLVAKVKNEARRIAVEKDSEIVIVDGSPGIGCPVVSSLSGADFVVLVTEPTLSALHDLKRAYELVKRFHLKAGCIINKSDLNNKVTGTIENYLQKESIIHISSLPYDEAFTKAMTMGLTIVEYDNSRLKAILTKSWQKIEEQLNEKEKE